ncbi:MAG: hypothetical protein OXO50_01590 [Caldilineaceae bacterium]|nr:hypothetical protein [Caldilineaceae bacterium]
MDRAVEERFERIEKNLETASKVLQEAVTLSRENQTTIQQILGVQSELKEEIEEQVPRHRQAA